MNEEAFNELVDQIMALGHDEETACHYASLIGDVRQIEDGQVIVTENGEVIARLDLPQLTED